MRYLKPFKDALGVTRTPGDLVPDDLPGSAAAHYKNMNMIGELADDDPLVVAADSRAQAEAKAADKARQTHDSVVKQAQDIAKSNRKIGDGEIVDDDPLGVGDSKDDSDLDPEEEYERLDEIADKARDKARRYERQMEKETDPAKLETIQAKFDTAKVKAVETRAAADAAKPQ